LFEFATASLYETVRSIVSGEYAQAQLKAALHMTTIDLASCGTPIDLAPPKEFAKRKITQHNIDGFAVDPIDGY
jgi:hypothetical protein